MPELPDRDALGRLVRETWVQWAQSQTIPKKTWLLSYDQISENDREADRQIGEAVANRVAAIFREGE